MKYKKSYLVKIQFLGFRFHGWQKQKEVKTLHDMVDKSLSFVLKDPYKTIGVGRTDAKVSAACFYIQLFIDKELENDFLADFDRNLPPDIKAKDLQEVNTNFNIIQHPKVKTYGYYFAFGEKSHPYGAPFLVTIPEQLNISLMQEGAQLFKGKHWFHKYVTQPTEHTIFEREILHCEVVINDVLTANFFPEKSYLLKVEGAGFLRYQIRLIMGTLIQLGKGEIDLDFIKVSLRQDNDRKYLRDIAPSSGLHLMDIALKME